MTSFHIGGRQDYKAFVRKVRQAHNGKTVQKALTATGRELLKPVAADVKAAVLRINSKGVAGQGTATRERKYQMLRPKGRVRAHNLRATVARTVKTSVRSSGSSVGLAIYLDPSAMPNQQKNLPAHLDNPRGWRHPTWAHRDRWVQQLGDPYFRRTVAAHNPRIRDGWQSAVDHALEELQ